MRPIDPARLDAAFVPAGAPSFADLVAQLERLTGPNATRRRDLASGLRRVARALGRRPEETPADPGWLQPRLAKVAPAAVGMTRKSWSNALSDARAAMALFGLVKPRQNRARDLSPLWRPLWKTVIALRDPSLQPALGRFVHFLDRLGVAPDEVSPEHAEAYRDAVALNEIRRSPESAMRAAAYGWNRAVRRVPGWPPRRLDPPLRDARYVLPLGAFPATFAADLARFVESMARPDPLDPEALSTPLRPATERHRRAQALRFASALVHAGTQAEEISSLAALVEPVAAERGLRWMLSRRGGDSAPGIADVAVMLKLVAHRHARLPEDMRARIDRLAARLALPGRRGLTETNRARLRPLRDPGTLRRLLQLPERLEARADAGRPSRAAALDREMAIAIAILLVAPVRRRNLVELRLDRHLQHSGDGRVHLVFADAEVKNGRRIEFELPARVADLIDRHVAARAPALCPPGTPWLFPRRDGRAPMEASFLSRRISATLRRELGLEMHPHLFRHLAAMIWLDANPGSYEAARRLLGHAELSSTLNAYAGFEADGVPRAFAALVDSARRP